MPSAERCAVPGVCAGGVPVGSPAGEVASGLAGATKRVQDVPGSGRFSGAQWLDGNPNVDDAVCWLALLVDTTVPHVGHVARPLGSIGPDGGHAIVDGARYLSAGVAVDGDAVTGCTPS